MKNISIAIATLFLLCSCSQRRQEIVVNNPATFDRTDEITEICADSITIAKAGEFIITDAEGREIPYQLTYDNRIIFPASVKASDKTIYTVMPGTPAPVDTIAWGRQFPERKDDMAWENDRSAYRAYGPALQQSGERAFGYDIWTKSVPYRVLEKRFDLDINKKISFHVDHGEGMDVYAVGPTLGGGTAALLDSAGNIVYPYCYESYEILDNGPLRFTVSLRYAPLSIDGDSAVIEERMISLDKGSWLNRTSVTYTGLRHDVCVAPGIVIHRQNPEGYTLANGYMSYADSTENSANGNGVIFVGVVSPESRNTEYRRLTEPAGDATGHILAPAPYADSHRFTYYWGSGWSKGGMPDKETWDSYLGNYLERLKNPLRVYVK